jgi:hypothetical protein
MGAAFSRNGRIFQSLLPWFITIEEAASRSQSVDAVLTTHEVGVNHRP